ncbi:hypothetical protein GSI_10039 [Ganoderma sinense ZZ0214-1]|uniref:Uncharacterized protein n=1 Tax=Ganoderma sinense ZZ0214-1 TaxID=1077348 RepID=A0A2G8RZF7_9APHY|nr:hypothetical protein GSI_10039 [Ganoderma sinense ZZ0214-1]
MQNIETLASSLDAQVVGVMQSLQFSDSPLVWSSELAWIFPEIYRFVARSTKRDIRAVARFFQRTSRTGRLSDYLGELTMRAGTMRNALSAADYLTAVSTRVPHLGEHDRERLRGQLPILTASMASVTAKLSVLRVEVTAHLEIFHILEGPQDTVELLLSSLPNSIPETYVTEGQALIAELVRMWSERRVVVAQANGLDAASHEFQELEARLKKQQEVQPTVLASFEGLVDEVKEVPALRLDDREFAAREFSDASSSYRRLLVRRMSLHGEASRLEILLDRFLDIAGPDEE